ncbi:hypothetical protein CIPAW_08G160300 [Carya illinoinensis]|uniref:Uncharacterized protein n=1 Tax=Carya illinoinensis TaxID=32201 RepID=A0A8T1PYX8_CARIL|nr:hypothetical protein CIPAW_08G160300 [Carya illinoinensis]
MVPEPKGHLLRKKKGRGRRKKVTARWEELMEREGVRKWKPSVQAVLYLNCTRRLYIKFFFGIWRGHRQSPDPPLLYCWIIEHTKITTKKEKHETLGKTKICSCET